MSASSNTPTEQAQTSAAAAIEPLPGSESASVSQPTRPAAELNKRAESVNDGAFSEESAAVSPCALPIELLVEIFLCISSTDVARTSLVFRTWHASSKDPRLWRHLSFTHVKVLDSLSFADKRRLSHQLKSIGARSSNTVLSIDFANLSRYSVCFIARGLELSASSLKHIRWSSGRGYGNDALRSVAQLAECCPQLATLELRSDDTCGLAELYKPQYSRVKISRFSLAAADLREGAEWSSDKPVLFDSAAALSFKPANYQAESPRGCMLSVQQLARVLKNSALMELTVHGLWSGTDSSIVHSLSAPSLTYLDLRWSRYLKGLLRSLDAPQLRELAIDAGLLRFLTPASTSALSSLTLRIAAWEDLDQVHPDKSASDHITEYHGSIKISVQKPLTGRMLLSLLAKRLIWPGLEQVEVEVAKGMEGDLISVIAARQAGARGATEAQYLEVLVKFRSRMTTALDQLSASEVVREAQRILELANAFPPDADTPPLCSQVQWNLVTRDTDIRERFSAGLLEWLDEANVEVQIARSA